MRVFIALPLSEENRNKLVAVQNQIKNLKIKVRWVERENIHLTLKFLGEIPEDTLLKIKNALTGLTSRYSRFEIELEKLGFFPTPNNPRVVWVGIRENEKLNLLAQEVEKSLVRTGFPPESRPFKSHLTIGRVKFFNRTDISSGIPAVDFIGKEQVEKIQIMESKLIPPGPIYKILEEIKLGEIRA